MELKPLLYHPVTPQVEQASPLNPPEIAQLSSYFSCSSICFCEWSNWSQPKLAPLMNVTLRASILRWTKIDLTASSVTIISNSFIVPWALDTDDTHLAPWKSPRNYRALQRIVKVQNSSRIRKKKRHWFLIRVKPKHFPISKPSLLSTSGQNINCYPKQVSIFRTSATVAGNNNLNNWRGAGYQTEVRVSSP